MYVHVTEHAACNGSHSVPIQLLEARLHGTGSAQEANMKRRANISLRKNTLGGELRLPISSIGGQDMLRGD